MNRTNPPVIVGSRAAKILKEDGLIEGVDYIIAKPSLQVLKPGDKLEGEE